MAEESLPGTETDIAPRFLRAHVREVDPETLYRIMRLRVDVFVVEQDAPYSDLDGRDLEPEAELFWVQRADSVLATLRLIHDDAEVATHGLTDGPALRIGRVVADPATRGTGIAGELMRRAVARCDELAEGRPTRIDAQEYLVGWYSRHGFTPDGGRFLEDGIWHVPMIRSAR